MLCVSPFVMASLVWEKPSGRNWGRGISEPEGGQGASSCLCASPPGHLPEARSGGEGLQSGALVIVGQGPSGLKDP